MVEVLGSIAFAGVVLSSGLMLKQKGDDQATGRANAETLLDFQQVAVQYFHANRVEIEAAMGGDMAKAGVHCLINVPASGVGGTVSMGAVSRTCAFDATSLKAKGVWPTGLTINTAGGRYVAIVRQVMASGAPTGADEMLFVLATLQNGNVMTSGSATFTGNVGRTMEQLHAGASTLGGAGGYIPPGKDYAQCKWNGTTKQVCGATWAVNLSDFLN